MQMNIYIKFHTENALKWGYVLLTLLSNFMLKYAVLKVQENQQELKLNRSHYILVYSDNINMLGKNINTTTKITEIYSLLAISVLHATCFLKPLKKRNRYTSHNKKNYPSPQNTWAHRWGHTPKTEVTDTSTAVSSAISETHEDDQCWSKHVVCIN
jgi:hypothetical protein